MLNIKRLSQNVTHPDILLNSVTRYEVGYTCHLCNMWQHWGPERPTKPLEFNLVLLITVNYFTKTCPRNSRLPMQVLYYIQIILAIWYVPLFFSLHKLLGSFLVLAALWSMLCIMLIMFARIYYFAGILVVPYLLWVTFNTILNFSVYRLN